MVKFHVVCKGIIKVCHVFFPSALHDGRVIPFAILTLRVHELIEFCFPFGHFFWFRRHIRILHLFPDATETKFVTVSFIIKANALGRTDLLNSTLPRSPSEVTAVASSSLALLRSFSSSSTTSPEDCVSILADVAVIDDTAWANAASKSVSLNLPLPLKSLC